MLRSENDDQMAKRDELVDKLEMLQKVRNKMLRAIRLALTKDYIKEESEVVDDDDDDKVHLRPTLPGSRRIGPSKG